MAANATLVRYVLTSACIAATIPSSVSALDNQSGATEHVAADYPTIELLHDSVDVLGRPLSYPDCVPKVRVVKITLAPGQAGKAHQHTTPLFGYIIDGELSVTYQNGGGELGEGVTKVYKTGDALMEAIQVMHHGFNATDKPATLLAVYLNCAE